MYKTPRRAQTVSFTQPFLTVHATMVMLKEEYGGPYDINTIEDLVTSGLPYGTQEKGMVRKYLRLTNSTFYKSLHSTMETADDDVFMTTNEEGLRKVRQDKSYVYILPDNIAEYMVLREPCDLKTAGQFLMIEPMSLAVDKDSSLLSHLNHALTALADAVVLRRLHNKWWLQRSQCQQTANKKSERSSNPKPIQFFNGATSGTYCHSAVKLLAIGFIMLLAFKKL